MKRKPLLRITVVTVMLLSFVANLASTQTTHDRFSEMMPLPEDAVPIPPEEQPIDKIITSSILESLLAESTTEQMCKFFSLDGEGCSPSGRHEYKQITSFNHWDMGENAQGVRMHRVQKILTNICTYCGDTYTHVIYTHNAPQNLCEVCNPY